MANRTRGLARSVVEACLFFFIMSIRSLLVFVHRSYHLIVRSRGGLGDGDRELRTRGGKDVGLGQELVNRLRHHALAAVVVVVTRRVGRDHRTEVAHQIEKHVVVTADLLFLKALLLWDI